MVEVAEAVLTPEAQALEAQVQSLGLIRVIDPATYEAAGERWKALVGMEKKVHEHFDPTCDAAHRTWKAAVALRDKFLAPLAANKVEQTRLMKTWAQEEERKRVELERQAQAAAKKKADDEALAAAAALEKEGFKDAAEEIIQAPPPAPVVIQPRVVPKGMGGAIRTTWKAQAVDLKALVAGVAAGTVPMAAILPNDVFLGQQARALKAECKYPGVRVWEE